MASVVKVWSVKLNRHVWHKQKSKRRLKRRSIEIKWIEDTNSPLLPQFKIWQDLFQKKLLEAMDLYKKPELYDTAWTFDTECSRPNPQ